MASHRTLSIAHTTMARQMAAFVFLAFLAGAALASRPLNIQEEGSTYEPLLSDEESSEPFRGLLQNDPPSYPPPPIVQTVNVTNENPLGGASDTAQNVVSRSKLTLPDSANKSAAAQNFIEAVGSNGVIEKRKESNGFATLSASYDLADAMLTDALSGAPLSTAGRLQFTADADNNVDVELTLFYPDGLADEEMEADATEGIARMDQQRAAGTYSEAFRAAGQKAGFGGKAVTMSGFDVVQTNTNSASSLKSGLWGLCMAIGAILILA